MLTQSVETKPRTRAKSRATSDPVSTTKRPKTVVDFEFSEKWRDSRIPPGWWIVPGFLFSLGLFIWAVM